MTTRHTVANATFLVSQFGYFSFARSFEHANVLMTTVYHTIEYDTVTLRMRTPVYTTYYASTERTYGCTSFVRRTPRGGAEVTGCFPMEIRRPSRACERPWRPRDRTDAATLERSLITRCIRVAPFRRPRISVEIRGSRDFARIARPVRRTSGRSRPDNLRGSGQNKIAGS